MEPATERPIYQQIVASLRRQIETGEIAVGAMLPSEGRLQAQFAVSRHTVREALRALKEDGLIESRQGAGSRVLASARPVYTYAINSVAELMQYATEARYEIDTTKIVTADAGVAARLEADIGSRWLRVEGLRYVEGAHTPLCWTEVYILSEYAGVGVMIGRQASTVYSFIEDMYGVRIDQVRQSLYAAAMPAAAAAGLDAAANSLAIVVRRIYRLGDGSCPLVALNYHVPERLRLDWTLQRSQA